MALLLQQRPLFFLQSPESHKAQKQQQQKADNLHVQVLRQRRSTTSSSSSSSSISFIFLLFQLLLLSLSSSLTTASRLVYNGTVTALPSASQLEWMEFEVGVMITFNLQTFCVSPGSANASKQYCQVEPLRVPLFDAVQDITLPALDTDVWMNVSASFGAKYAVLVADHMTGFTLYPTKQHNFSVASIAWKDGKGDIVQDFRASCTKFNIAPGFFYSTHYNWFLGVNNYEVGWPRLYGGPNLTQSEYEDVVIAQLEEIAAYGDWVESWYDGGVNTVLTPRVGPAVQSLFPTAMCHSCFNFSQQVGNSQVGYGIRWMGNEEGVMPLPSVGAITSPQAGADFTGNFTGSAFFPPSCDTVLDEHYWFWQPSAASHRRTTCGLSGIYLTSVGRNSNLILNMAPNPTGGLDEGDAERYADFGNTIQCFFAPQRAFINTSSASDLVLNSSTGSVTVMYDVASSGASVRQIPTRNITSVSIHLQEDISSTGQRIGQWTVELCLLLLSGNGRGGGDGRVGMEEPGNDLTSSPRNKQLENDNCTVMGGVWTQVFQEGYPIEATTGIGHKRILRANLSTTASSVSTERGHDGVEQTVVGIAALRFTAFSAYHWHADMNAPIVLRNVSMFDWTNVEDECMSSSDPSCVLPNY